MMCAALAGALSFGAGCGGPSAQAKAQTLSRLKGAIRSPIQTREQASEHSRLVEQVMDEHGLRDRSRSEVVQLIGQGEPCARHPRCAELGFEADDWFYTVGAVGGAYAGQTPELIVGFDSSGHVRRLWNFRTHE